MIHDRGMAREDRIAGQHWSHNWQDLKPSRYRTVMESSKRFGMGPVTGLVLLLGLIIGLAALSHR